jgi:amino acid transporter
MIVVSVFQLISCVAVPIAFCKLRKSVPHLPRPFQMPAGKIFSYLVILAVSYLLAQCGFVPLILSLVFHLVFFILYCSVHYRKIKLTIKAFASSWSLFVYMGIVSFYGYLQDQQQLNNIAQLIGFIVVISINYYFLLNQKTYNQ